MLRCTVETRSAAVRFHWTDLPAGMAEIRSQAAAPITIMCARSSDAMLSFRNLSDQVRPLAAAEPPSLRSRRGAVRTGSRLGCIGGAAGQSLLDALHHDKEGGNEHDDEAC